MFNIFEEYADNLIMSKRDVGCLVMVNQTKGFTLVELLIVITMIGVLAMIAIPSYNNHVTKTRRSDAKISLMKAAQDLERCFTENDSYTSGAGCTDYTGGVASDEGFYTIKTTTQSAAAFTVTATPVTGTAQADDSHCASFAITNTGAKSATNDDCW
jgi:type IV pilus assembly protein PilE